MYRVQPASKSALKNLENFNSFFLYIYVCIRIIAQNNQDEVLLLFVKTKAFYEFV